MRSLKLLVVLLAKKGREKRMKEAETHAQLKTKPSLGSMIPLSGPRVEVRISLSSDPPDRVFSPYGRQEADVRFDLFRSSSSGSVRRLWPISRSTSERLAVLSNLRLPCVIYVLIWTYLLDL
jgi:hypothetical protein